MNDNDLWSDSNINFDDEELIQVENNVVAARKAHENEIEVAGFDGTHGDSWIYPINYPLRAYQLNITQNALFRNTLVCLPTGLGKTFIAAVVMYNIYRWYPKGKVIFMAPTRPLVAQQIDACQRIMPFKNEDTIELTGRTPANKRIELWQSKRVFFATPQVVYSDIMGPQKNMRISEFPFDDIKLLVIDEAHKAKGRYAYTEVVQSIGECVRNFRVLALSATPGRSLEDVAEVIRNLFISHLEVRSDNSIDVSPYLHHRNMKTIVVRLSDEIKELREEILTIIDPYARDLFDAGVLGGSLGNLNRNFLLYEQKRFRDHSIGSKNPHYQRISTNFSICISLYHAVELLERHGLRVFLNNFDEDVDGRDKFVLTIDRRLNELVERLRAKMGPNPFDISTHTMTNGKIPQMPNNLDFGHPKFEEARKCLLKHFEEHPDTRAIVFCEYRESVMLIYRLLLQHQPILKPRCFVGQGGTTGSLRALTQKQQIQIMADFRCGKSNILIATSIGEEGIDVGEVDMIVCFDISTSNPTRFVQRIGRTGRQKDGSVIALVTEGREQQTLKDVISSKDQINKKIIKSTLIKSSLYQHAPRMVPKQYQPQCIQTVIESTNKECKIAEKESVKQTKVKKVVEVKKVATKKSAKAMPVQGTQDLRNFFAIKSNQLESIDCIDVDDDDLGVITLSPSPTEQSTISYDKSIKDLSTAIADFDDISITASGNISSKKATKVQNTSCSKMPQIFTEYSFKSNINKLKDVVNQSSTSLQAKQLEAVTTRASSTPIMTSKYFTKTLASPSIELSPKPITYNNESKVPEQFNKINNRFNEFMVNDMITTDDPMCEKKFVAKRYTKLNRYLKSSIPMIPPAKRCDDLAQQLKSKTIKLDIKKLILKYNIDYSKQLLDKMRILNALDMQDNSMSKEELEIREIYDAILPIFDDDDDDKLKALENLTENGAKEIRNQQPPIKVIEENVLLPFDMDDNFDKAFDDIFVGLDEQGINCDNFDYITESLIEAQNYRKTIDIKVMEMMTKTTPNQTLEEDESTNKPNLTHQNCLYQEESTAATQSMVYESMTENLTVKERTKSESYSKDNECPNFKQSMVYETPAYEEDFNKSESNSFSDSFFDKQWQDLSIKSSPLLKQRKSLATDHLKTNLKSSTPVGKLKNTIFDVKALLYMNDDDDELFNSILPMKEKTVEMKKTSDFEGKPSKLKRSETTANCGLTTASHIVKLKPCLSDPMKKLNVTDLSRIEDSAMGNEMMNELDFDVDAFMEPFPEEIESTKFNRNNELLPVIKIEKSDKQATPTKMTPGYFSPDIFDETFSPCKQIAKNNRTAHKNHTEISKNVEKTIVSPKTPKRSTIPTGVSPKIRQIINSSAANKTQRSPTLYNLYRNNSSRLLGATNSKISIDKETSKDRSVNVTDHDDSPILMRKVSRKRKIFDDDDKVDDEIIKFEKIIEEDESVIMRPKKKVVKALVLDDTDTDIDAVIPASQKIRPKQSVRYGQRIKRRRQCAFIDNEAIKSGSEDSEDDENEISYGNYELDSVVVAENDVEYNDDLDGTNMHAFYLNSVKSPEQRLGRGAFKIPIQRTYNDRSLIYSQALIPEENSQYLPDSFIVNEEDEYEDAEEQCSKNNDITLCPLERAERILKEQRRAKRKAKESVESDGFKAKKRKKIIQIQDSDDE